MTRNDFTHRSSAALIGGTWVTDCQHTERTGRSPFVRPPHAATFALNPSSYFPAGTDQRDRPCEQSLALCRHVANSERHLCASVKWTVRTIQTSGQWLMNLAVVETSQVIGSKQLAILRES